MSFTLVISSLARGGADRVIYILASDGREQGKEGTLLSSDQGDAPAYALHPLVKLRSLDMLADSNNVFQGLTRNISRIKALHRAIRDTQPDMVISFMDGANVLTLLATRGLRKPVIISEHIDPSHYDIGPVWNSLRKLLYPLADAIVCPTSASVARFQAMTRARGLAIANPIDVPPGCIGRERPQDGGSPNHVLAEMGRLVPQKGFELLLKAVSQVAHRHPDWTLTILGDGPILGELQTQAESLDLNQRVNFAGAVSDPFPRLGAADLFVLSSRFEGFGMALAEAMACGLPGISFDCPEGPADIIRDGVDGVLVPPEDLDALAAAVGHLMGDPGGRKRLAARAPEVLERFSTGKARSQVHELFGNLVPGV